MMVAWRARGHGWQWPPGAVATLRDQGHAYVVALLAEGNTCDGFDSAFGGLGKLPEGLSSNRHIAVM
jgi:hypothetical protein